MKELQRQIKQIVQNTMHRLKTYQLHVFKRTKALGYLNIIFVSFSSLYYLVSIPSING